MCAEEVDAVALETLRLTLEPVRAAHAQEMAPLLADVSLYVFTGGVAPTLAELRARYARQAAGRSPDGVERWCNWIARRRADAVAIGFVQATVSEDPAPPTAVLAWALGAPFQRQGYAREAAAEMMRWLRSTGVTRFAAYIHPAHVASMAVARALGMAPTEALVDGEVVWESRAGAVAGGDVRSSG
jgi:RimJ/RimL family protein N-acetyltransferase